MTRGADSGESRIIEDYFDAWLDVQADPAPNSEAVLAARPQTDSPQSDDSVVRLIDRASRCAELISGLWPAAPTDAPVIANASASLPLSFDAGTLMPRPARLGRFLIAEELGRGRFGIVYRGHDSRLQRDVAIKVARPEVTSRDDLTKRFLQEAAAAARLDHPGIVPVHEAGEIDQHLFYVMPYCEGEDLAHWLGRRDAPVGQRLAADLIRQIAEATHHGHTQGIIHRDLKPANILLVPQPGATAEAPGGYHARILDFGLSRSLEMELQDTRSSMIVGTPLYMSPEQASRGRREIGPATDIFALGAILYELLTGEPPFAADSLPEVIERLAACEPASPKNRRGDVDPRLEQICLKCLRLYPEDRYATAQELADDLGRFLQGEPVRARRATWFDHLRWWGRRPRRITEAGTALFVINFTLAVSMLLLILAPMTDQSMASMRIIDLLYSLVPGAAAGFAVSWIGILIVRGSRIAIWLGIAAVTLQWIVCTAVLFFGLAPLLMYEGNPRAKLIMHLFLFIVFSLELLMCLIALYARRMADLDRLPLRPV